MLDARLACCHLRRCQAFDHLQLPHMASWDRTPADLATAEWLEESQENSNRGSPMLFWMTLHIQRNPNWVSPGTVKPKMGCLLLPSFETRPKKISTILRNEDIHHFEKRGHPPGIFRKEDIHQIWRNPQPSTRFPPLSHRALSESNASASKSLSRAASWPQPPPPR